MMQNNCWSYKNCLGISKFILQQQQDVERSVLSNTSENNVG